MLTVLLATRDRASLLHDVLEAYCHLQSPPSGWKVVIVNNGSTDHTDQVIASFADRLPIQSVLEPKSGKNYALNAGLDRVEGDLTVLTDDDVFPAPDWLVHLRKAADELPEYSMFGGRIIPRWEVAPPAWIQWINLGPIFTTTPPSMKEGPIPAHLIFGPNMAIRSNIFQSGIRFDSSIGPCGPSYPMGSETEILLRLGRQGNKSWHVSQATVEHFVRKPQAGESLGDATSDPLWPRTISSDARRTGKQSEFSAGSMEPYCARHVERRLAYSSRLAPASTEFSFACTVAL